MLTAHSGTVTAVSFSPDGKYIASYSYVDGKLLFWQVCDALLQYVVSFYVVRLKFGVLLCLRVFIIRLVACAVVLVSNIICFVKWFVAYTKDYILAC